MGPQQGQKVFTLRTFPASSESEYGQLANTSGFSLRAVVFANADEPEKLEKLCRYISRPAISERRLSMTQHGKVRYELKTHFRDGTTHVFFDPIDFISKLVSLIPPHHSEVRTALYSPKKEMRHRKNLTTLGR